ncbi:MAG TPA: hypothetical protein VF141_15450 [Chryseolinea sp.]
MRIYNLLRYVLLTLIGLSSCSEDQEMSEYPDLKIYLDRFEQEAGKLGYDFDLSKIQVAYVDEVKVNNNTYCGYGYSNYDGAGMRRIEISKSNYCNWAGKSDIEKENLFFHEIGHAFFLRAHDEAKQCDGSPLSLMNSTTNSWRIYDDTEQEKRTYYISELIDPLVALEKCINYGQDFKVNPVLYNFTKDDEDWFFDSIGGNYFGQQGPDNVLTIATSPTINTDKNGYWFKQFQSLAIPECAEVKLKVRMNSTMLTGKGAVISVRAYHAPQGKQGSYTEQLFRLTTENNPKSGELIDHTEELTIPCYTRKIIYMVIFVVMLGDTQGEVDFDQIQLVVKEK